MARGYMNGILRTNIFLLFMKNIALLNKNNNLVISSSKYLRQPIISSGAPPFEPLKPE